MIYWRHCALPCMPQFDPRQIPFVPKRPVGPEPWREFGASRADFEKWAPHICGIACARSLILGAYGYAPSLWKLTEEACRLEVFRESVDGEIRGAYHKPLAALLMRYGLRSEIFSGYSLRAIRQAIDNYVLLLSVDLTRVSPELRGSHLVLVLAMEGEHNFIVQDNANVLAVSGDSCLISEAFLDQISRGQGIRIPLSCFF
jgi:hypothetical protein